MHHTQHKVSASSQLGSSKLYTHSHPNVHSLSFQTSGDHPPTPENHSAFVATPLCQRQASLLNSGAKHSKNGLVGGKGLVQHMQSSGFGLSHCGKTLAFFPLKVKYIWSLNLLAILQLTTHGITVFVGEQ